MNVKIKRPVKIILTIFTVFIILFVATGFIVSKIVNDSIFNRKDAPSYSAFLEGIRIINNTTLEVSQSTFTKGTSCENTAGAD